MCVWFRNSFTTLALLLAVVPAGAQVCREDAIVATAGAEQFQEIAPGELHHARAKLVWQRCALGQTWNATANSCTGSPAYVSWPEALQRAAALRSADTSRLWRLPNIKELGSIVEYQCAEPFIDLSLFPSTPVGKFWSSTYMPRWTDAMHVMDFQNGASVLGLGIADGRAYVRLVRDDEE